MPPGLAWSLDPLSTLQKLLRGKGEELARVESSQTDLMREGFGDTATVPFLLTDWEQMLGLPDECTPVLPAIEAERQQLVRARLIARGGQNEVYFLGLIESLGCTATIESGITPITCESNCDDSLIPANEIFVWRVKLQGPCDLFTVKCLLEFFAPAHTFPVVEVI